MSPGGYGSLTTSGSNIEWTSGYTQYKINYSYNNSGPVLRKETRVNERTCSTPLSL